MAQLYKRKGGEVLVNTETANGQLAQNLALLPGGGFVVVWNDGSMVGTDSSGFSIKAQRFDSDGDKLGGEILVNTHPARRPGVPQRRHAFLGPIRRQLDRLQRDRRRYRQRLDPLPGLRGGRNPGRRRDPCQHGDHRQPGAVHDRGALGRRLRGRLVRRKRRRRRLQRHGHQGAFVRRVRSTGGRRAPGQHHNDRHPVGSDHRRTRVWRLRDRLAGRDDLERRGDLRLGPAAAVRGGWRQGRHGANRQRQQSGQFQHAPRHRSRLRLPRHLDSAGFGAGHRPAGRPSTSGRNCSMPTAIRSAPSSSSTR